MFSYQKKLQYPVKIDKPNPKLASIIISEYGGPDGELGASLRFLSQRYAMPFDELKGLLTDIGTEWSKWGMPEAPRMHRFDSSGMHETPFGASWTVAESPTHFPICFWISLGMPMI